MNVELNFGALSAPLQQQLRSQGLAVLDGDSERLDHLQRDADALVRLVIRDVLTDSAAIPARRKLIQRVCALKMTQAMPARDLSMSVFATRADYDAAIATKETK